MLLQRLKEYADLRMELPPPLYSETAVRYIIELTASGQLMGITDTADPASPRTKRGQRYRMPQVQRASAIQPLLLADKADYTLGLGGEASKPARVIACHRAYTKLVERCAVTTEEPSIKAVQTFLGSNPVAQLHLPPEFDHRAFITFRVDGLFPTELPSVRAFWAAEHDPGAHDAQVMQCIVCGQERPVLERLQGKLKGVPGGQTSGTAIISANATAFESYGLKASLVAPTCANCGERFTKAANELLSNEQSRMIIGGAAFLFWTREEVPFDFSGPLNRPDPQQVQALIESVRSGKRVPEVDDTPFYATVLSGSGGRAVVRDWIDTTVGAVKHNLARWFERQQIADDWDGAPRPLSLYGLARTTVREMQDLPTTTPRALLRSALTGAPLPIGLLYEAVRRSRVEQSVTRPRAALIKLVLLSQQPNRQEGYMVDLDLQNAQPAYRCGRLLTVLAEIQRNAIGKVATVDRFYGAASSAPAAVFGRLLHGAQPHLSKLERDRPGGAIALRRRLEDIMTGLQSFPTTLTLEQQGLFALGFYHQRIHDRAQMNAAAAPKRADAAADDTATNVNAG